MKPKVTKIGAKPSVISQPENDGAHAWLYDDSFTDKLLAVKGIPSPTSRQRASKDEKEAAKQGELLCVLTPAEFWNCGIQLGLPSAEFIEKACLRSETTFGFLHLPTGRMRVDGINYLRIYDVIREEHGDVDPASPIAEVEPGWYRVVVYRSNDRAFEKLSRSEQKKVEALNAPEPFISLVKLDNEPVGEPREFFVGFPVKRKKKSKKKTSRFREKVEEGRFTGKLTVGGEVHQMKIPPRGMRAIGYIPGALFTIESLDEPDQHVIGVVTRGNDIRPDKRSQQLTTLMAQKNPLALLHPKKRDFNIVGDSPFKDGDHAATITPAEVTLNDNVSTRIHLTVDDDRHFVTVPDDNAQLGEAFEKLVGLVDETTGQWRLAMGYSAVRENQIVQINVESFAPAPPSKAETMLTYSMDVPGFELWEKWPRGFKSALLWQAKWLRGSELRTDKIKVSVEVENDTDDQETAPLCQALRDAWNEAVLGQPADSREGQNG